MADANGDEMWLNDDLYNFDDFEGGEPSLDQLLNIQNDLDDANDALHIGAEEAGHVVPSPQNIQVADHIVPNPQKDQEEPLPIIQGNNQMQALPHNFPNNPNLLPQDVLNSRYDAGGHLEVLIRWILLPEEDNSWVNARMFSQRYPDFNILERVHQMKGGFGKQPLFRIRVFIRKNRV